jgi:hypothetical protein
MSPTESSSVPVYRTYKVTPLSVALDLLLTAAFGGFMFKLVSPHVMSSDPKTILFFSASTAACMSGVFYIATQMFRVVLRQQRERNAAARK